MDDYTKDQLLQWYERIEKVVLDFAERVPLSDTNEKIEVPKLVSPLMDACGLLDSVWRDMTPNPVIVGGKSKTRGACVITDFAELYAKKFDLPNTRSILRVTPQRYRTPFASWAGMLSGSAYTPLPWWQVYNELKHDRLRHMRKATLEVALDGICALHQVLSKHLELIPILLRRRWFTVGSKSIKDVLAGASRGRLPGAFVVETELFAVLVGQTSVVGKVIRQFPQKMSDVRTGLLECKQSFVDFMAST